MYTDFLFPKFISNRFGDSILGQRAAQSPHPLHLVSSMYRGFLTIVAVKVPELSETVFTSDKVNSSILGFLYIATILGARTHKLQSCAGNNLSN
ncbi:hypothetical protein ES703_72456 [subsurface metagenome]